MYIQGINKNSLYSLFCWQFIKYVQAYMTEARWLNKKYKPTLEEYIRVSTESSGYALAITNCYIGMGDLVTEDIFKWVSSEPKMINAAIVLCRLMDDIVSNEVYIYNF
jgi:(-)-germacrene D synthase